MKDTAKKIKCSLVVRGSSEVNAIAEADLKKPDPDRERALAAINKALEEKEHEPDGQEPAS